MGCKLQVKEISLSLVLCITNLCPCAGIGYVFWLMRWNIRVGLNLPNFQQIVRQRRCHLVENRCP